MFLRRGSRDSSLQWRDSISKECKEIHNESLCGKMLYPKRKREVVFQYLFFVRAYVLVETTFFENKVSVHMLFQDYSSLKRSSEHVTY